jgi:hypothetical protein
LFLQVLEGDHSSFGSIRHLFFGKKERPDGSMGTYIGTLVALYAVLRHPFGNMNGNTPFFIGGCSCGESTVFATGKGADRQAVAILGNDRLHDILDEIRNIPCICGFCRINLFPFSRNFNL